MGQKKTDICLGGSLDFVSKLDFVKENVVLRAQFQMLILALHLAVHISFTPNFNRVKVLVPDLILQKFARSFDPFRRCYVQFLRLSSF